MFSLSLRGLRNPRFFLNIYIYIYAVEVGLHPRDQILHIKRYDRKIYLNSQDVRINISTSYGR